MLVAGVDLAATRPSALALYDGANFFLRYYDNETLVNVLKAVRPSLVALDAPLSLPSGPWRDVDLKAKKRGIKVLPPGWKGMRKLTEVGTKLKSELEGAGIRVVETFPAPLRKVFRLPFEGDLRDAALCALVAFECERGSCFCVEGEDGSMCFGSIIL